MFLGQYYHNIDEKGRLTIPARYRELIQSDGAYLLQGFESNLIILPSPYFDILSHRVNRTSFTDPTARHSGACSLQQQVKSSLINWDES